MLVSLFQSKQVYYYWRFLIFPQMMTFAFNPPNVVIYNPTTIDTVVRDSDYNQKPSMIQSSPYIHVPLQTTVLVIFTF